jgi:phosphate transport system substrate-binding protein
MWISHSGNRCQCWVNASNTGSAFDHGHSYAFGQRITVREDGAYVEAGENDNLIVQKLTANKDAIGIFGYSFLEENLDKLKGAVVDGVSPTYDSVASGKYPASRPLFIYVKKQHVNVIPGIPEFIAEYTSEKALGEEGYLADKGLIPPLKNEIGKIREDAKALKPLKL